MKSPGRKLKFTPKQTQRFAEMKAEGLRNHEIAKIVGVSTATIIVYLRKYEASLHPKTL